MRIAVLGTRGFPNIQGGIEAHCENLYTHLVKKGYEVIVFTRRPYVDSSSNAYKGVKLISLPCLKNKFLETFSHTLLGLFAAKKLSPDILHIHGIGPSLVVPIAKLLGLKVVVTNHGPDYKREKWKRLAKLALVLGEFLGVRYADRIICVSRSNADTIKRRYKRKAVIIPNGVILPQVSKSNGIIKKYNLNSKKYILSVGRLVPEKGFYDLVEAFEGNNGYKLVIAGEADHPGRYSSKLKQKASKNRNIILTGFLNKESLRQLYSHAGLFVLPSYYEGLPIALLEAMSHGLPCIVSDIAGNRDVGLGRNRFFKVGDIKVLAAKMRKFINKPMTSEDKKRQIKMVSERYNWENITNRTLEVYKKVKNI